MGLQYSGLFVRSGGDFVPREVRVPGDASDGTEYGARVASQPNGEALFIFVSERGNGFQFEHARNGEIVRALSHADSEWGRNRGSPEPWERVFFREELLERLLEDLTCDYEDPDRTRTGRGTAPRHLGQRAHRSRGAVSRAGRRVANAIHAHFGLPAPSTL